MDRTRALQVIADAIGAIAPEIDLGEIDASVPFAAEADLDSMDLLSLAAALHEATGVDIDDGDLPSPWTLDDLVGEVATRAVDPA